MSVPSGIKIRRLSMGIKQDDLCNAIDYSQTSISEVEHGTKSCAPDKVGPWLDFLQLERGSVERREAALYMMPSGYASEMRGK